MDDKTVQKKLNQLTKIANELTEEAKSRYGAEGGLFYEADGSFHLMSGDAHEPSSGALDRQEFVEFSSNGHCRMDCGAW